MRSQGDKILGGIMQPFNENPFCKMLGIKYPIIQGGMAWIADACLATAVSNAGGLGLIAAMNSNGEQLKAEIRKAKMLTDKPFGVNIMLQSPFVSEAADMVIAEDVKIITTGAGTPAPYMEKWLRAGIKVMPVVPSAAYARLMQRCGAAAVICEGTEAGGHIGEITTMALTPQVCDTVTIPVAAAGGIADGRGMAAAFMLGAQGVQIGTRFLAATECCIHKNYKSMVFKAGDTGTVVTGKRFGHPVRSLKSAFSLNFQRLESDELVTPEEILKLGSGALRIAVQEGDLQKGSFMAGQSAGMVKKEQFVAEIIAEIVGEFKNLLKGAAECLG